MKTEQERQTLERLTIEDDKIYNAQHEAIKANPIGGPVILLSYISGNSFGERLTKNRKEQADAFIMGEAITDYSSEYIPVQYYKIEK